MQAPRISGIYTPDVGERLLNWTFMGAFGIAGYGIFIAAGLPEWTVFPMVFIGAFAGAALIARWRSRRGSEE